MPRLGIEKPNTLWQCGGLRGIAESRGCRTERCGQSITDDGRNRPERLLAPSVVLHHPIGSRYKLYRATLEFVTRIAMEASLSALAQIL